MAHTPTNTGHSPNDGLILAHRLRRRANIKPSVGECPLFNATVATCRHRVTVVRYTAVQAHQFHISSSESTHFENARPMFLFSKLLAPVPFKLQKIKGIFLIYTFKK